MERINQKTTKQIKRENKNWLLLVTVNDIETNSLLSRLKPLEDYSDILVAYSKNNTYFIGRFGAYNVIHVQSRTLKQAVVRTKWNSLLVSTKSTIASLHTTA